MGVTRQNHQLMLPFTEVEAGETRGNHRQGAEAPAAAYETERPVSSTQAVMEVICNPENTGEIRRDAAAQPPASEQRSGGRMGVAETPVV